MELIKMEYNDIFAHGTEYTFKSYNSDNSKNLILCCKDLKEVYKELFDEALKEYNSTGYRVKKPIVNYYKHIKNSKQERLFYKYTIQIGDENTCVVGSLEGEISLKILKKYEQDFMHRNKNLKVFHSAIYLDRITPYLVISFVPVANNQTRGLSTKNSLRQALIQQGFQGRTRSLSETFYWCSQERKVIVEIGEEFEFDLFMDNKAEKIYKSEEFLKAVDEMKRMSQHMEEFDSVVARKQEEVEKLEKKLDELSDMVELVETAKDVQMDFDDIKPQKTFTNAVRGVTVEQIENLKLLGVQNKDLKLNQESLLRENNKLQLEKIELQNKNLTVVEEINNVFAENKKLMRSKMRSDDLIDLERDLSNQIIKFMNMMLEYSKEELPESFENLRMQVKDNATELVNFYIQEKLLQEGKD